MGRVCRDEDGIPWGHGNGPVLNLEFRCPFEDDHPFVLVLVVPEAIGGPVARGDDPLNPDAVAGLKNCGQLCGQVGAFLLSPWNVTIRPSSGEVSALQVPHRGGAP